MSLLQALLLGILQGLTEFIPVSSTAHLLIGQQLLGIPAGDATFSFLVIVQLGTIVSLFGFYWKDLLAIIRSTLQAALMLVTKPRGTWNMKPETLSQAKLGWYILVATIPALIVGYLLKDAVEALFKTPLLEACIRLFSAAILLSLVEWLGKRVRQLDTMNWFDALIIGLFQAIAVFPGASRSGATIAGGMTRGFDRPASARFAFLMSVPVMLAAGAYQMLDVITLPNLGAFLPALATGFVAAAILGWFAVKWLIGYLGKHSLYAFAIYCAALGTMVFFLR